VATSSNSSVEESTETANAFDGSFANGGSSVSVTATDIGSFGTNVEALSVCGGGGFSLNGNIASFTPLLVSGTSFYHIDSIGNVGLAGGAIKGSNVTVYNLAADSSKFRVGNSDSFTLITV
jgi:hypothetical protein